MLVWRIYKFCGENYMVRLCNEVYDNLCVGIVVLVIEEMASINGGCIDHAVY